MNRPGVGLLKRFLAFQAALTLPMALLLSVDLVRAQGTTNSPPSFPSTESGQRDVAEDATANAAIGTP